MQEKQNNFVVSKENWSLHRKGFQDQKRHMEKVQEAIRDNLPEIISEENIIASDGREVIKIPIRSLDEYKIRYNFDKQKHVGQGDGKSKVGDVVARDGKGSSKGPGKGKKAGDQPGVDYYEAEITLAEIEDALFKELELPDLVEKEQAEIKTKKIEFNDVRKKGLMGNIDKKRTILSAIKRNARKGKATIAPIQQEDLRFKTWNEVIKQESNAVVLAMMDTSGSMGNFEKYIARSFFFWMTRFLRSKYESVDIAFIAHHTEAKEVDEGAFFSRGESGGTICSSAYVKALELIEKRYDPIRYNIYPFHISDGDNLTSDNVKCTKLVKEIMEVSNMFGYGEVNPYSRYSTLMYAYKNIDNQKFRHFIFKENRDVYYGLKHFFKKSATNHQTVS